MIGLPALRRGGRAVLHAALALAVRRAVRRALAAWALGDPTPFTRHTRHLRGTALRIYRDLYYAALPVRSIELPDVPAPAPRIRDAVESPRYVAAPIAPVPAPATPSTRGAVRRRIKEVIDAHTEGQVRADLSLAVAYGYEGAIARAGGLEKHYAIAALRLRAVLADRHYAQPAPGVHALCLAIECLLRDRLCAALGHLDRASAESAASPAV